MKSVLLSGDYVSQPLRDALEQTWGCAVFEHYGSTETGLGGAVQCRAFAGRHVREADLLLEVIDPGSGRLLTDGEYGEIVLTTLTRRGMPLIRYRTGDEGRILPEACVCGSLLRSLGKVRGRLEDRVDVGGGHLLSMADLDEALLGLPWMLGFTASVNPGMSGGAVLHIEVELGAGAPAALEATVDEAVEDMVRSVPAVLHAGLDVEVCISRSGSALGPAKRRIVDRRGESASA